MKKKMFSLRKKRKALYFICTSLLFVPAIVSQPQEKCLKNLPDVMPKKYPHYLGHQVYIRLEMSERVTHQLLTYIFQIFLIEILGYARIEIVRNNDNFRIDNVIEHLSDTSGENVTFPAAMINLEVWVPPEFDAVSVEDTRFVKECGNVAPLGRFGWFIPKRFIHSIHESYTSTDDLQELHWSLFRDREAVKLFDVDNDQLKQIRSYSLSDYETSKYNCEDIVCDRGMYVPEQCLDDACGLLLASHYESTKFVIQHIAESGLYMKVMWFGNNLKTVLKILGTQTNKSYIFLHYIPSDLVYREDKFISVAFPRCEMLNFTQTHGCKYENSRLIKLAWNKIEQFAKPLYQTLRAFHLEKDVFQNLMDLYNDRGVHEGPMEVACKWMKTQKSVWIYWKTSPETDIHIGGIFPITSTSYNGAGIVRGALMAKNAINSNKTILPNYKLQLTVANGQCRADNVMKSFIDYIVDSYYNNLLGVLGPACSDTVEPLAGVSKHYHIVVISYSAEGASFSDRKKYPYFFRTIGENKDYKHVYLQLFQTFGWKRVAALAEDGQKYTEYIAHMQDLLEQNGVTFIANAKFPRERETSVMTKYLEDLKRKSAKIIIADVFDDVARTVLCEAFKLRMTSSDGYVWFLPAWLNTTWYDTDYFNTINENVNCTTANMITAANGYFSMSHAYFAPDDNITPENITVAEWKHKYQQLSNRVANPGTSNFAGYAYDAVWTYALALHKLIETDPEAISDLHSENTTIKLVKMIEQTDFWGVSGRIKFRGGPSRFSVINIMQWYDTDTYIVGSFHPNLTDDEPIILGGRLNLNFSLIRWFTKDKKKPDDGTLESLCALEGLAVFFNVDCEMAIIILNMMVAVFVLLIVFGVVYMYIYMIKKRYDKKVEVTQKYMKHLGIDFSNPSLINDLDKWEVPRGCVSINRKLGEGAFGTVYGGEAKLGENEWVAVAVKTLKVGSSGEEKLDFLSEAEVMKRFDHKNIVQLLGVCTKEEPVYTIMEFMLYGDLRTYLLARRHMVSQKNSEESEISNKKLTSMALDVARALSYITKMKYVHRDIASRNCLVNNQRTVKLGDFGMTRPMNDSDYYKFIRKGMLPVRWMAPESLVLGIFTPASDVWSYGVLLYEIITFGGFPFQGLSNYQVLEYVKSGNTLSIPSGLKPQLACLIKSCWNQDPKQRTPSFEIVEFLANNPRLLSPCLDIPLTLVELEDSKDLEVHLPGQFRKTSTPNINHTCSNGDSIRNRISYNKDVTENGCIEEPLLKRNINCNSNNFKSFQHESDSTGGNEDGDDYMNSSIFSVTRV